MDLFRAKVVDVSADSLSGGDRHPEKLTALLESLEPYGIGEIAQSGMVTLARGPRGIVKWPQLKIQKQRRNSRMPVEMFYDDDADLSIIQGRKVGVIGYGSQGHAHSLSLRDSGAQVKVGLKEGSKSARRSPSRGSRSSRRPRSPSGRRHHAAAPDTAQADIFETTSSPIWRTATRCSSARPQHRFDLIKPPANVTIGMVAPRGPVTWCAVSSSTARACRA